MIESLILKDPDGKDVTEEFNFKLAKGSLHVYYSVLSSKSADVTKTYDDQPIDVSSIRPTGALMQGHTVKIVSTASTNAGVKYNSYSLTVVNEANEDVSYYYEMKRSYGKLTINPREISIKANDDQKVYDGTALSCNKYTFSEGTLLSGHKIDDFTITGSQTEVGRCDNILTAITIVDASGKDVTANYAINLLPGPLRVTAR